MEIANSLYYTFSTIAQVLAGYIALCGVFVIFKVQELKRMQFIQVLHFTSYLNGISGVQRAGTFHGQCPNIAVTLQTLHQSECLGGMESEMKKILEDTDVAKNIEFKSLQRMKSVFDNIDSKRLRILLWTKFSIVLGVLTILYSLTMLTLVPYLTGSSKTCLCYLIGTGFVGLLLSICPMTYVIFYSLNEKNYLIRKLTT